MNAETKLPATPRRVPGAGADGGARPPSGGWEDFYPEGSGLRAALFRRVARAQEAVEAGWPLGTEREERNLIIYKRAVARYLRLREALRNTYGVCAPVELAVMSRRLERRVA